MQTISERPTVLSPAERASWEEHGFLVLRSFFSDDQIEPANERIEHLWEGRRAVTDPITVDYLLGSARAGHARISDTPDDARHGPYKLNNLIQWADEVRALSCDGRLADVLAELLGGEPMAFNSLNFERGSQQGAHFDTWFMPAPVQDKMVAAWIALEDIEPATGPLMYYPGSHLVAPHRFSHGHLWSVDAEMVDAERHNQERIASRMRPDHFFPRKGDVLIWHSQLLHGGEPIEDLSLTRKSLVTHYFRLADFDVAGRALLGDEELGHRYGAMRPNWRPYFVHPTFARAAGGRTYLDTRVPPPEVDDATALAVLRSPPGTALASASASDVDAAGQLLRRARRVGGRALRRVLA